MVTTFCEIFIHFLIISSWSVTKILSFFSYRKVNLSIQLYHEVFKNSRSRFVVFDFMQGSLKRIIHFAPSLRLLKAIQSMVVESQEKSYGVQTSATQEHFERLVIKTRPVKYAIHAYEFFSCVFKFKNFVIMPILFCIIAIILYFLFDIVFNITHRWMLRIFN